MADGTPTTVPDIVRELSNRFGDALLTLQPTADGVPTAWLPVERLHEVLRLSLIHI